jgi:hypothetical protein
VENRRPGVLATAMVVMARQTLPSVDPAGEVSTRLLRIARRHGPQHIQRHINFTLYFIVHK